MDLSIIPEHYRRWVPFILSFMTGVTGGFIAWIIVPSLPIIAMTVGFIFGSLGTFLFISLLLHFFSLRAKAVNSQFDDLYEQIYETKRELRSMINVRPLMGKNLVSFGDWTIDGQFGETLIGLVQEKRPKLVLECGSGTSTVLVACLLKEIGSGKIIALEHLEKFASVSRQHLEDGNLEDVATIKETPLRKWSLNGNNQPWYDFEPDEYLKESIDILIVDGPPGHTGPLARYPAVPILKEWLSPNGVIILDDGNREDERKIAEQWIDELNATHEFYSEGKGTWIIQNHLGT